MAHGRRVRRVRTRRFRRRAGHGWARLRPGHCWWLVGQRRRFVALASAVSTGRDVVDEQRQLHARCTNSDNSSAVVAPDGTSATSISASLVTIVTLRSQYHVQRLFALEHAFDLLVNESLDARHRGRRHPGDVR